MTDKLKTRRRRFAFGFTTGFFATWAIIMFATAASMFVTWSIPPNFAAMLHLINGFSATIGVMVGLRMAFR